MSTNPWRTATACTIIAACVVAFPPNTRAAAESLEIYRSGQLQVHLIGPSLQGPTSDIVTNTINGFFLRSYGWELPLASNTALPGIYLVAGNPQNNPVLQQLVTEGLNLDDAGLGDEGFRILTHQKGERRFIIIHAKTAQGLKYGCQELIYYRIAATTDSATIPWPLEVMMKPAIAYRGCYMLPCWSAHDSLESWERVLQFHSELALNRNWFWLNGFPLLPQYGGIYHGTALSDPNHVRQLIQLCHREGMKFCIGGGWFTWHHKESASGLAAERVADVSAGGGESPIAVNDKMIAAGVQYYIDLLAELPEADGFYLEPTGEGTEADDAVWGKHVAALALLLKEVYHKRPDFEVALAIGRFNSIDYRRAIHELAPEKTHWFWAWGDPLEDQALAEHPQVLRWHTTQVMSPYHGSHKPPQPREAVLTGLVTSWDPGMGFGNAWNGWPKIGVAHARNFHPYTMPYFSHQYWFRERCWNLELTEQQFAERLAKRLFDSDMPTESIDIYLQLAAICPQPARADRATIERIEAFVERHDHYGTLRNKDTLNRMREALDGIESLATSK